LFPQLNFVGVTVSADRPYLHFPGTRHDFAPVAIGDPHSPIQVYELYNGGAVPVSYHLDLSPLASVTQVGCCVHNPSYLFVLFSHLFTYLPSNSAIIIISRVLQSL